MRIDLKLAAVTVLAALGGWYLFQTARRPGGLLASGVVTKAVDSVASQRFAVGAKAQQDAAKAAALGGPKALADATASENVKKS